MQELRDELDEAESFNDPERAAARARGARVRRGRAELAPSGSAGATAASRSASERARVNVTRALRREIRRIADQDAGLGQELQTTVRTGTFCLYQPDLRHPVTLGGRRRR